MSQNQQSNKSQSRKWRTLVFLERVGTDTLTVTIPAIDDLGGYVIPMPHPMDFIEGNPGDMAPGQYWLADGHIHISAEGFDFVRWGHVPVSVEQQVLKEYDERIGSNAR